MVGDQADMVARLRAALPGRWFGDVAPVLDGVLAGVAAVWTAIHDQLRAAIAQTRIATATGSFIDMIALDFFGSRVRRRVAEADDPFRVRVLREMRRERGTRAAVIAALVDLTGRVPQVFEPARPGDTGAWNGQIGYGVAGRWGSLMLPRQCFVTAFRPAGQGIAQVSGWGGTIGGYGIGAVCWADHTAIGGQVTDTDIAEAVADVMPAASIAWLRISS
jgi:hypothetical protein